MKKQLILTLGVLLFFSACAVKTVRQGTEAPMSTDSNTDAPQSESPNLPVSQNLKKTIVDQDLKKNNDDSELKKRIVMLPLIDKKSIHSEVVLNDSLSAFMDALNESGELIAIDSAALKVEYKKYLKNGNYDLKSLAQVAGKAGVSSLLETRLVDMRFQNEDPSTINNSSSLKTRPLIFEVVVQVRMVSARTGQELFNTVKTLVIDDPASAVPENVTSDNFFTKNSDLTAVLIKDALTDFKPKLVESLRQITWEGRIAAMSGDKIYLNVGRISGVKLGDLLKVVEDGNEIYDTELGYHVGQVQGRVKGTLEVISFFGQDGAVGVIHSGAGFKENDRIEVYQ